MRGEGTHRANIECTAEALTVPLSGRMGSTIATINGVSSYV